MQVTGTLVEQSNAADNYCTEALGAVAGLLVIKVATTKNYWYLKQSQGTATTDDPGGIRTPRLLAGRCTDDAK